MPLEHIYTSSMRGGDSLDIHSISSVATSHLTSRQLKQLSKSPISKRLHVSTNEKYVIPIPFTLQLPPKLSPKNRGNQTPVSSAPSSPLTTPLKETKRTRLVYTGQQYEIIDDTDTEDELRKRTPGSPVSHRAPLPKRPSKLAISKSKSNVHMRDNLSIIEEVSVSGSSRQSSVRDKPPPVPPKDIAKEIPSDIAKLKFLVQPQPIKVSKSEIMLQTLTEEKINTQASDSFRTLDPSILKESGSTPNLSYAPEIPQAEADYSEYTKFLTIIDGTRKISNTSDASTVSELNNTLSDMQEEYIRYKTILEERERAKRLEESDQDKKAREEYELYIKKKLTVPLRVNERLEVRNASGQSTSTTASSGMSSASEALSTSSWNSLQRSIDISIAEMSQKDIQVPSQSRNVSGHSEISSDYGSWEDENSEDPSELLEDDHEAIVKANDNTSESAQEEVELHDDREQSASPIVTNLTSVEPLVIRKLIQLSSQDDKDNCIETEERDTSSIDKSLNSDNEGVGKRFYFPNNLTNATNDENVKQRSDGHEQKRKPRMSFMSNTGQIEIPDIAEMPSASSNETQDNFKVDNLMNEDENDLQPIGVSISSALISDSEDSDFEANDWVIQGRIINKSESAPILSASPTAMPQGQVSQRKLSMSPVRHQRSRSIYNISLDIKNLELASEEVKRDNRSTTEVEQRLAPAYTPEVATTNIPEQDSSDLNIDLKQAKSNSAKEIDSTPKGSPQQPILIAEPPKRVNYDVDFKELSVESDEFHENKLPTAPSIMEIYANFVVEQPPKKPTVEKEPASGLNIASILNNGVTSISSYQSSRSYKGTASSYTTHDDDTESVVIDLTKEKFDVTHVVRHNSVLSYKSVTEKTKDGKLVEVVLLDDEDTPATNKDELESLYSKYRHFNFGGGSQFGGSTRSSQCGDIETSSFASFTNSVSSSQKLSVKRVPGKEKMTPSINLRSIGTTETPNLGIARHGRNKRSTVSSTTSSDVSRVSVAYKSTRIIMPKDRSLQSSTPISATSPVSDSEKFPAYQSVSKETINLTENTSPSKKQHQNGGLESNYFDYTTSEKYDFKSFMKGRTIT